MPTYLADVIDSKDNNFNLIRMLAAFAVLFSHSFALSTGDRSAEPLRDLLGITFGQIAVDIFFVTSGLLVTRSLLYRNNLLVFAAARILRIYPGLLVAVGFCLLLGLLTTTLPAADYLSSPITRAFAGYNSVMLLTDYQQLPGVFEQAPFDDSVNGSLWTLPWELRMYLLLAALGTGSLIAAFLFRWHILPTAIVLVFLLCLACYFPVHFLTDMRGEAYKLLRFGTTFFFGASLYVLRQRIPLSWPILGVSLLLLGTAAGISQSLFFSVYTLTLPLVVLCLAYLPGGLVRRYNRLGDYSYGVYIYAWPVQQLLATSVPDISVAQMILFSATGTLVLAYLSWHGVESRALRFKSRLRWRPLANPSLQS